MTRMLSSRAGVGVRPATAEDLPALTGLLTELRDSSGASWLLRSESSVTDLLTAVLADPRRRVLLADIVGRPVGMTVLSQAAGGTLAESATLRMDYMVVTRWARRHGVGRALIAASAGYAEEQGLEQVAVSVLSVDRESNRFFARLGFAPVVVNRVISTVALRRNLVPLTERPVMGDLHRRRRRRRPLGVETERGGLAGGAVGGIADLG